MLLVTSMRLQGRLLSWHEKIDNERSPMKGVTRIILQIHLPFDLVRKKVRGAKALEDGFGRRVRIEVGYALQKYSGPKSSPYIPNASLDISCNDGHTLVLSRYILTNEGSQR